ncbi:TetR/AcrR family transcriptional regulator [Reinekea blandensis]|uniref:HTH transcriptional regulator TetR family protein n=1 Tax=Reinekea blandensis MED297 TaxID=314283 RepID=A4BA03_9GAMM|nr:TetR/AcrR family transcriptional regulator [Reinekea blandensis]EAR11454.1 HTH transcriptional regulator TetR family protein [Reinekea sp. MED297] [Reinekea blandensis MED297]
MKTCSSWQRARRDDQIEQREAQILQAASDLFDQFRYDDITLARIAKAAGFTRSNLYRYFPTREDVFLTLMSRDMDDWVDKVTQLMSHSDLDAESFVDHWMPVILSNPRMMRFYELLAGVFEQKASAERLLAFKQRLHEQMAVIIDQLLMQNLFASSDGASRFLVSHLAFVSGLYPKLHVSDHYRSLMESAGYEDSTDEYRLLMIEGVQAFYDRYRNDDRPSMAQ